MPALQARGRLRREDSYLRRLGGALQTRGAHDTHGDEEELHACLRLGMGGWGVGEAEGGEGEIDVRCGTETRGEGGWVLAEKENAW